mgnify:CR=1 FL=1
MTKSAKPKERVFNVEKSLKMNPNETQGSVSQTCPVCGMEEKAWADHGQGYRQEGELYCCRGCAADTGCTCKNAA